jgi:hypothetical protein
LEDETVWERISGLRAGGDGSQFNETESQGGQGIDIIPVFVETGGKSHRVFKFKSHDLAWSGNTVLAKTASYRHDG